MRFNHKGDLNLSVSAVVILILAVTMLGLGLAFIKNIFGGAIEDLNKVREDIRDNVIKDLRNSNERLGFYQEDIRVKRAGKKDVYFGVKNELNGEKTFGVGMECLQQMTTSATATGTTAACSPTSCDVIDFDYFEQTPEIVDGGVEVMKVILNAKPNSDRSTYLCVMKICGDSSSAISLTGALCLAPSVDPYAQKNFFITIE